MMITMASAINRLPPKVAFFHQNEPNGMQGGIERYLSTILSGNPTNSLLVTEACEKETPQRISIPVSNNSRLPKGLRYLYSLIRNCRRIRKDLLANGITALEFSRPELVFFAFFLGQRKTFTIHGSGPPIKELLSYIIHHVSCFLLPFVADLVQIVGRDPRGLPYFVLKQLGERVRYIDAWYATAFSLRQMPPIENTIKIFYAGRLSPMKNPSLLFKVIRAVKQNAAFRIDFRYFGSDDRVIKGAGLENLIQCCGLKSEEELAQEIGECHAGILCSTYGEGSPFIIVESLACGRPFIAPPIRTLIDAYANTSGVVFPAGWKIEDYLIAIKELQGRLFNGLTAQAVRSGAKIESQEIMSQVIFAQIAGLS